MAGLAVLAFGRASPLIVALAALPLLQLLPGAPPSELAEAMAAAEATGPGTIAADPSALSPKLLVFVGSLAVFALARTGAQASPKAAWWATAAVAAFGCFEAALGIVGGPGAAGTLVNRGQYATLLEMTFGAGCGLAAASWAGRSWRQRLEERALLGGIVGLSAAALSLAGIAVSLSRTGIVAGAVAGLAAAAWFGRNKAWVLGAATSLTIGLALASPGITSRALDRFDQLASQGGDPGRSAVWADAIELAEANWLTGVGLGSFPSAFRRSSFYLPRKSVDHAHSDYLEWIVELGAPAATLLLSSVLVSFIVAARNGKHAPLAAGCALGAGATLLHATVDLPLQQPGLAALLAALLGLASGAGGDPATSPFRVRHCSKLVVFRRRTAAAALGLSALLLALVGADQTTTPENLYLTAAKASAKGELDEARQLYRRALDRNLFTAAVWLRLAELERAQGRNDRAHLFFKAARTVEPFTLRTEWPLAEMELAAGDTPPVIQRLAGLVIAAPDLLEAALHTVWRSGATVADLEPLVPRGDPDAAGRYLAFLVRNRLDSDLPKAYARLGEPALPQLYRDWLAREAGFQP